MSRVVTSEELKQIEKVISEYPEGIGISALEKALTAYLPGLQRRTLQRRLKKLQEEGRITTEGKSIALIYKTAPGSITIDGTARLVLSVEGEMEASIPISKEGEIIRDLVRQPRTERRPIGYQQSFLEEYEPGVSYYLSESLRNQFHKMGSTPGHERPAGTYAREILNRLLIDLSWASSRLEGNTYNRLDTRKLIEFGQAAEGKDLRETQMILNHKAAIEMLIEEADQVGFNSYTFLNLHSLLSENLLTDEKGCGRLRHKPVEISGSVFHPIAMPQKLEECFQLLLKKAAAIPDPFEQAFFIMVQLPYLQPFEDVNKRVSRLGANIPLIRHNLCPLSFIDVPEQTYVDGVLGVYELNQIDLLRDVFIWAYERSCQRYMAISQNVAEPDPLRIRYREALIQAVREIVKNRRKPSEENIAHLATDLVQGEDRETFKKMIIEALQNMHEGSVARYRLKLSEYQVWKKLIGP